MSERGRFAPSPTGDLHLGGARTALAAWLAARAIGGQLLLRMEDLDRPRVVQGAAERILEDLRSLGLDWDEGPDAGGTHPPSFYRQSERTPRYLAALRTLEEQGLVYPCYCSRAEVARAASAPQGGDDGPRYPGTCQALTSADCSARERQGRRAALRFRVVPGRVAFHDGVRGAVSYDPSSETGDFVIRRSDGLFAYQLAVVVDDADAGITQVVRGDDLLPSTARQILLYQALGAAPPRFAHVPLVLGPDGQRLSKRHGSVAVRDLLAAGMTPRRLLARLASSLLAVEPEELPVSRHRESLPRELLRDLLPSFSLSRIRAAPSVIDPAALRTDPPA